MLTAIIFILILGVLIFVHELGHFLTARRNGIRAEEFGFGFPPRIFGFAKYKNTEKFKLVWGSNDIETDDTVYSLNWIPLGGFVKIKGENGEETDAADSFSAKSAWVRIKVLAAGVMMNFLLAWLLIAIVFMTGAPAELASHCLAIALSVPFERRVSTALETHAVIPLPLVRTNPNCSLPDFGANCPMITPFLRAAFAT